MRAFLFVSVRVHSRPHARARMRCCLLRVLATVRLAQPLGQCRCLADPDILPKFRVDRGAIRFVLSGANIMAPGLTSAGGEMDDVPAESVVAIMAEGKEHALAIGISTM